MNKYNVGDVVKLRDDLEDEQEFDIIAGTFVVDEEVLELKNTPLKIVAYKKKHGFYIVEFSDGKTGRICDEMIEGLWEEKQDNLKLIDVFNMIANGELKEGTKVKFEDIELNFKNGDLEDEDGYSITCIMNNLKDLLSEVELIEPPCEHEWSKYSVGRLGRTGNYRRCKKCGIHEEDIEPIDNTKIEELIDWYATTNDDKSTEMLLHIVWNKLNEVIRMVNAITNLLN